MKDLIEKILVYSPAIHDGPWSTFDRALHFSNGKKRQFGQNFRQALQFFVLSICLVVIIATPNNPPGFDIWRHLARVTVSNTLILFVIAGLYRFSFWLVGGQAPFRSF